MLAIGWSMADGSDDPARRDQPPTAQRPGTFAPFGFAAFRNVWAANTLSQIGAQVQLVGAGWLMTELTSEHRMVAGVQAANAMAMLFLSVPAGALADNFDRRRIMLLANWFMLLVSAVLAVQAWRGQLTPWSLLGFSLLVGAGMTMQLPAWQASVRALVDGRVLPQAISLNSVAFNLARTVGPALGGMILAVAGVSAAFAVNALSYVALIAVFARWRPRALPPRRQPLLPSIRAGLIGYAASPPLRRLLLRGMAYTSGAMAVQALLPVVVRNLHGGETDFGVLLGAFGVGSVAGAIFAPTLRRRAGAEWTIAAATATVSLGLAGLSVASSVLAALPCVLVGGMAWALSMTTMNVSTQLRAPEDMLGRIMSINQATVLGAAAIAAWGWGTLADFAGLRRALGMAAGYMALSGLFLHFLAPMPARGEGVVLGRA